MARLAGVVQQLKKERARAQREVERLEAAINLLAGRTNSANRRRGRRRLSAAARKRIAAAQRARWAKIKGAKKAG